MSCLISGISVTLLENKSKYLSQFSIAEQVDLVFESEPEIARWKRHLVVKEKKQRKYSSDPSLLFTGYSRCQVRSGVVHRAQVLTLITQIY